MRHASTAIRRPGYRRSQFETRWHGIVQAVWSQKRAHAGGADARESAGQGHGRVPGAGVAAVTAAGCGTFPMAASVETGTGGEGKTWQWPFCCCVVGRCSIILLSHDFIMFLGHTQQLSQPTTLTCMLHPDSLMRCSQELEAAVTAHQAWQQEARAVHAEQVSQLREVCCNIMTTVGHQILARACAHACCSSCTCACCCSPACARVSSSAAWRARCSVPPLS